jgi:SAM-dependent methyltransferase
MAENRRGTRIVGDVATLDYGETLAFFDERAQRAPELDRRTITMYQDTRADLAERRDAREAEQILPLLQLDAGTTNVLDVGCGVARWGGHLAGRVRSYTGFDFSAGLVELATADLGRWYPDGQARAFTMSATELRTAGFDANEFDLVIVSGVLAYLNEADCARLLDTLAELASPEGQIYVREPMARTDRLTLRAHWSDELSAEYSAIYRSVGQYDDLFAATLTRNGWSATQRFELSPDLANRSETGQFVSLFSRGAAQ